MRQSGLLGSSAATSGGGRCAPGLVHGERADGAIARELPRGVRFGYGDAARARRLSARPGFSGPRADFGVEAGRRRGKPAAHDAPARGLQAWRLLRGGRAGRACARQVRGHCPLGGRPVSRPPLSGRPGRLLQRRPYHLAAALGAPRLPQTFLIPVRQRGIDVDEPKQALDFGREPAAVCSRPTRTCSCTTCTTPIRIG